MKCRFPIERRNKLSGRVFKVPCGQCMVCRINHSRQWAGRIHNEQISYGDRSSFITLTYDNEHLPVDLSVHVDVLQRFLKRFRKDLGQKKIRYFGCGEYGDKFGRPHYHIIVFGVPVDSTIYQNRHQHYENGKPCGWHCDLRSWPNGKVHVGTVTYDSANYVAGYVLKKIRGKHAKEYYETLGIEPEFVLMSRMPGIGYQYVMIHADYYRDHPYLTIKGVKYPLPRYYKDKLGLETSGEIKRQAIRDERAKIEIDKAYCKEHSLDYWRYIEDMSDQFMKNLKGKMKGKKC